MLYCALKIIAQRVSSSGNRIKARMQSVYSIPLMRGIIKIRTCLSEKRHRNGAPRREKIRFVISSSPPLSLLSLLHTMTRLTSVGQATRFTRSDNSLMNNYGTVRLLLARLLPCLSLPPSSLRLSPQNL